MAVADRVGDIARIAMSTSASWGINSVRILTGALRQKILLAILVVAAREAVGSFIAGDRFVILLSVRSSFGSSGVLAR